MKWVWLTILLLFGIDDYQAQLVQVYPNPASQSINIKNSSETIQIEFSEIIDQYGKLIATQTLHEDNAQINISNITPGLYFVRLHTNMGIINKKFVKIQ